jgi:hypothetical protein
MRRVDPEALALAKTIAAATLIRSDTRSREQYIVTSALLAAHAEIERLHPLVEACRAGLDALWSAYHAGAWEMNHDVSCPEDDTCECEGHDAAQLLSKASALLAREPAS